MDTLVLVSFAIILLTFIYFYIKYKFSYWQRRDVPTLPPSFPYGNFKGMGKTKHTSELVDDIYRAFKGKAQVVGAYFSITPALIVMDLDLCKDILIKDFSHFHDRPLYCNEKDDPLSAHLLHIGGEKWTKLRRILSPTFTSGKMKYMFPTVLEVSNRFVEVISEKCEQDPIIEIKDLLSRFTTDVIGSCAFGIDCNSLRNPRSEFRSYGKSVFINPRHSSFTIFLCGQFPRLANALGIKVYRDEFSSFFREAVEDVIAYREANNVQRNDFLDLMIPLKGDSNQAENDEKLTLNDIVAQATIFFFAGFETSASSLSYALYELAKSPAIQEKARNEVNEVLARYQGEFCYEAIMEMGYIDQIISETVRKYTPLPRLVRQCTKSYTIPRTGLTIEKGTIIFIPIHSIQNDADIFPNPDVFDPTRFSLEEVKKRHPMAYLGFGDGPRHCIGLRFGRMESALLIAQFLKKFEIKSCIKTLERLKFNLKTEILSPIDDMYFEIRKI